MGTTAKDRVRRWDNQHRQQGIYQIAEREGHHRRAMTKQEFVARMLADRGMEAE